mmetsp:Transcript_95346/g.172076  ORF Transcript_95346/g.172076 Transcript_95346/m.172076 type:complete len:247 (+) Transcript_95346:1190-1930(+)
MTCNTAACKPSFPKLWMRSKKGSPSSSFCLACSQVAGDTASRDSTASRTFSQAGGGVANESTSEIDKRLRLLTACLAALSSTLQPSSASSAAGFFAFFLFCGGGGSGCSPLRFSAAKPTGFTFAFFSSHRSVRSGMRKGLGALLTSGGCPSAMPAAVARKKSSPMIFLGRESSSMCCLVSTFLGSDSLSSSSVSSGAPKMKLSFSSLLSSSFSETRGGLSAAGTLLGLLPAKGARGGECREPRLPL